MRVIPFNWHHNARPRTQFYFEDKFQSLNSSYPFFCESVGFFRAAWDCGCKRKEINMWVLCRKCLFHCLSDKSGFDASDGLMLRSIYPLSQLPHLAIHSHSDPEASGYYLPAASNTITKYYQVLPSTTSNTITNIGT